MKHEKLYPVMYVKKKKPIYIYIYILAETPPFGRDFQLVPAESYVLASLRSASIYYIY